MSIMKPLNRKQRQHIDALTRRLEYVSNPADVGRPGQPDYIPGEAGALSWAITVLAGAEAPAEVRIEMMERRLRSVESRLSRIEDEFEDEEISS